MELWLFVSHFLFFQFSVIQPVPLVTVARNMVRSMETLPVTAYTCYIPHSFITGNNAKAPSKCHMSQITFQEVYAMASLFGLWPFCPMMAFSHHTALNPDFSMMGP